MNFEDRREKLFGRERDVDYLVDRVRFKGLTAVVARPAMGKSWLLTELARRLSEDHEPAHIVGFARSYGQNPDLLLRAVVDLYQRWLSDAGYLEQARKVWEDQKDHILAGTAKTFGKLLPSVIDVLGAILPGIGTAARPLATVVEDAINGLLAANRELKSGGIELKPLQYEQARDLVAAVAGISGKPVALIIDQWEQSPDPAFEAKTLHTFLHSLDEWPRCHLFVALQVVEPAIGVVDRLVAGRRGPADCYDLSPMDLKAEQERQRLIRFLKEDVPACASVDGRMLLDLVEGYPGVLYRWTEEYNKRAMASLADLERVAADAQSYRFSEIPELLKALPDPQRRMAIRLALLPLAADADAWTALKPHLLADLSEAILDDLRLANVLARREPPSFGHGKRIEAIRGWIVENRIGETRIEAAALIDGLASEIRQFDIQVLWNVVVLMTLLPTTRELALDELPRALCQAAATMFGDSSQVDDALIHGSQVTRQKGMPASALLLAIGLFNTLVDAKQEDDLDRRDRLLDEVRGLAAGFPDDAAVREGLAYGLDAVRLHASEENDPSRSNVLLNELKLLAQQHPQDDWAQSFLAALEAGEI